MQIILNGVPKQVDATSLSYEDLVEMEFGAKMRNYVYSLVYSTKPRGDSRRSGTITPGQTLELEEDIRISICDTSNA
jgi:hypothetical protein